MGNRFTLLIPESVKQYIRYWRERHLIEEILKLEIDSMGVSTDGVPWVKLSSGLIFYSFKPNEDMTKLYLLLKRKIPKIQKECFTVVFDIVLRYVVPRNLPGETVFQPSRYRPIRDPLNDFNFKKINKMELASFFRPSEGEVFIDLGSYIGFGAMRIASLVGSKGKVIVFESDPIVLQILKRNICENNLNNVVIVEKAVGNSSGIKTFYRSEGTVNSTNDWVLKNLGYDDLKTIEVDVENVDDALLRLNIQKVDMINITINGAEYDALLGMERLLTNSTRLRLTIAGWYYVDENNKVCDLAGPYLKNLGYKTLIGRLGRLLAWKE